MSDTSVPPAVDAPKLTSPSTKPATGSENVTVNSIGDALVGSAWPDFFTIVTVGAVVSTTCPQPTMAEAGDAVLALPAVSMAALPLTPATTSPDVVIPETTTS